MKINGLKVVDPMRRIRIHISKQDIAKAKKKDNTGCAAALCALREVPGCTEARVHLGRTYLRIGDKYLRFRTPDALRSEIIAFDRGAPFEPGEYVLPPMGPTAQLGVGYGSSKGRTRAKASQKKRAPHHVVHGVRPAAGKGAGK